MADRAAPRSDTSWRSRVISIGSARYPYHYGDDCMDEVFAQLAAMEVDHFFVVTDDTVLALHGPRLLPGLRRLARVTVLSQPPGESMKRVGVLGHNLEAMLDAGATRRSVVLAFGGGAPGNLAGLMAALLFRGVRLVHVPTTTTAAMDSVLSIKQAINSERGKNHFGTYHAPDAVLTDVSLLATLPPRELRSGLCEAAKNCLAIEPEVLGELRDVLVRGDLTSPSLLLWLLDVSVAAKTRVTAADTREQRAGLALEYGHTVGHAVELSDGRPPDERLSHGESVAFGMVVAAHLAHRRGWLTAEQVDLHEEIVTALGAPSRLPPEISVDSVIEVARRDNKRGYVPHGPHEVPFVLLRDLGRPAGAPDMPLVPVALSDVREVLDMLAATPEPVLSTARTASG
jgi:3-dehydroquinate synthase/2-deoxy-scyllo-inosose synthase